MFTKIVRLALTVIAYAGRALAETERRYSQTEKNIFLLCGPSFVLYTDDKTRGSNLWEPCLKQPSRIERWLLFTNFVSRANVGIKTQPISYRDIPQRSRTNTLMSQTLAYRLLRTGRSIPHSTAKIPPAQLLHNREMRRNLP